MGARVMAAPGGRQLSRALVFPILIAVAWSLSLPGTAANVPVGRERAIVEQLPPTTDPTATVPVTHPATPTLTASATHSPSSVSMEVRCRDCPRQVPEMGAIESVVNFESGLCAGVVEDVDVAVNIRHTWRWDISLYLSGPAGSRQELLSRLDWDGDDLGNRREDLVLDDEAARAVSSGPCSNSSMDCVGVFRTDRRVLRNFYNKRPEGKWTLRVEDGNMDDSGLLNDWRLVIRCVGVPTPTATATPGGAVPSWTVPPTEPLPTAATTATATSTVATPTAEEPTPTAVPEPTQTPTATATVSAPATNTTAPARPGRVFAPHLSRRSVLVRSRATPIPAPTLLPPHCLPAERQPNERRAHADVHPPLCPDFWLAGTLDAGDDWDIYRVDLPAGRLIRFELDLTQLPSGMGYQVALFDRDGAFVQSTGGQTGLRRVLEGVFGSGWHYAGVYAEPGSGRSSRPYLLRWRALLP